jgi:hypothetical protein
MNWYLTSGVALSIATLGSIFHFLFEAFGERPFFIIFFSTNESTFEHLKLVFWPTIIVYSVVIRWFKTFKNYYSIVVGHLVTISLIMMLFYMYIEGFKGKESLAYDIFIFWLSIFVGAVVTEWMSEFQLNVQLDTFLTLISVFGLFMWYTTCSYHDCANIYVVH